MKAKWKGLYSKEAHDVRSRTKLIDITDMNVFQSFYTTFNRNEVIL